MPQVVFYTASFFSITFNILIAWIDFSCEGLIFFINLAVPYLTLVIGNYLAGNIWILSIQLEQLIASKDEILKIQDTESLTVSIRVQRLKRSKRRVYALFIIILLVILTIFITDFIITRDIEDDASCKEYNSPNQVFRQEMTKLLPSILIALWVIIPAWNLKSILRSRVDDTSNFKRELFKIHCTNMVFIMSILYQCIVFLTVTILQR